MIRRLFNWLRPAGTESAAVRAKPKSAVTARVRLRPPAPAADEASEDDAAVEFDAEVHGRIENAGPGKNVLIQSRYVREDTGTHETLKILDDSPVDSDEESGIDPYNTGEFDRTRNWDKRFR